MRQFYILTLDPRLGEVFRYIEEHGFSYEVHLNRTRFWIPEGTILTEFLLRFSESCPAVDETMDLNSGLPKFKPGIQ